jgi:hypothetical protein
MGEDIERIEFTDDERATYQRKLTDCLRSLERMLIDARFQTGPPTTGLEIEFSLVDDDESPTFSNAEVLDAIADPDFQNELGRFNIETNVPPRQIAGEGFGEMEAQLRASLNQAEARAAKVGAHMVTVGILPTVTERHLHRDSLSGNPRYHVLSEEIVALRGGRVEIDIEGVESLHTTADSIAPEAACTSNQLHLLVSPEEFAPSWNAAQAIAGMQVALGANSSYFLGRRLWSETRIGLFEQTIDTRTPAHRDRGARKRVWFGSEWVAGVQDLFQENLTYFEPLLPVVDDQEPIATLDSGVIPTLRELRLHNGTVYRWNRPVYDVTNGVPHLRIENRVLPSGPTVVDMLANAAFFLGLVRSLRDEEQPIWETLPFGRAKANFREATVRGQDAQVFWPGLGDLPVLDLVERHLLERAADGLRAWGTSTVHIDRLLGVIEQRCAKKMTPATWWVGAVTAREATGETRAEALRGATAEYRVRMHTNEPIASW